MFNSYKNIDTVPTTTAASMNEVKLLERRQLALGKIIRDYEIGREFGEQEEGATTVACVTS